MPGLHRMKIEPVNGTPYYNIFLDDRQLDGVTGLTLSMGVSIMPTAIVEMKLESIEALVRDADISVVDDGEIERIIRYTRAELGGEEET